jgi:hypothetical protein
MNSGNKCLLQSNRWRHFHQEWADRQMGKIPVRRKKATSARDMCSLSLAYLRRKTKCREVLPARKQKCDML